MSIWLMAILISKQAMELRGCDILIGRDPFSDSLLVSVGINGTRRTSVLPLNLKVPRNVSRCKPGENIAHCRLIIDERGIITVSNLKEGNHTFIDGVEIYTKRIEESNTLQLGLGKFPVPVRSIIELAATITQNTTVRLERTRIKFETSLKELTSKAKERCAICNTTILMAILAWACTIVFKKAEMNEIVCIWALSITVIASIAVIIKHAKMYRMEHIEERKKAIDKYLNDYVCPHCGHFFGEIPAQHIKKIKSCPACKGEL